VSTNTDVDGFINNLDAAAGGTSRLMRLVLGAGGAAQRCRVRMLERGSGCISSTGPERARRAGDQFGTASCPPHGRPPADLLPRHRTGGEHESGSACTASHALELDVGRLRTKAVVADSTM